MSNPIADIEAERMYLGCAVLDHTTLDSLPATRDCFVGVFERRVFEAIVRLRRDRLEVCTSSVVSQLGLIGEDAGAVDRLTDAIASVSQAKWFHRKLVESRRLRNMRDYAQAIVSACERRDEEDAREALDALSVFDCGDADEILTGGQLAAEAFREVLSREAGRSKLIPTGLGPLDESIGGLEPGDLVVIGAHTSVGKSSLALLMADSMAQAGVVPGVVSCEDGKGTFGARLIATRAPASPKLMRSGQMPAPMYGRIAEAVKELDGHRSRWAIRIGANVDDVVAAMTRMVREHGCRALFVDYLQTINVAARVDSRREAIREIASKLKAAASRLRVPLILTSQLARPTTGSNENAEPSRHMLKESGDIENMAEAIVMLWRPDSRDDSLVYARLAKSKWGGGGLGFVLRRGSSAALCETDEEMIERDGKTRQR